MINSKRPSPPGDTIRDILDEREISRFELAQALDITDALTSQLLSGDFPIDSDIARRLSTFLGSTQEFWVERERQYQAAIAGDLHV